MKRTVEVFSDVVCPWCYVGKRRLERALALTGAGEEVDVVWRPFRLNPGMPPGGVERRAYREAKFGSWERALELEARVAAVGEQVGIAFAFDRIARTPDTTDAHRLLDLARERGCQGALAETLFRAYFCEGRDVGDRATLADLAADAGLDRAEAEGFLASDRGTAAFLEEEARGKQMGINGVPFFVIDGRFGLSGAREPEVIAGAIEEAARAAGRA